MLRQRTTLATALLFCCLIQFSSENFAQAQIKAAEDETLTKLGDTEVTRFQVGVSVRAKRGAVRAIFSTIPVPISCREQEVELVEEDISEYVTSHDYRMLQNGGARQMLVNIPKLPNKAKAQAILTFEIRTRIILPPDEAETAQLVIPKKISREMKRFVNKSPMIETRHGKLRKLSKEIFAKLEAGEDEDEEKINDASEDASTGELASAGGQSPPKKSTKEAPQPKTEPTAWQRTEALYKYVQDNIKYVEGDDKSAIATLRAGEGDCQNISVLFIALCRTNKIPARMVWVDQHCYPEFALADAEGKIHWFPCESSGSYAFGEMPLARVIMQKGDNFRVRERKKALRYVSEYMTGVPAQSGGGPPSHSFIRKKL